MSGRHGSARLLREGGCVPWPHTGDVRVVRALWAPVLARGAALLAPNACAEAAVVVVGDEAVPVTVSRAPCDRHVGWTTSARAMFGGMARDEARRLPSAGARAGGTLLAALAAPITAALDPVAMLDATGLSTQLHGGATPPAIAAAAARVREAWPGHALVLRSLDARQGASLLGWCREAGWLLVPARRVWYQDARDAGLWRGRNVRHDLALAADRPLAWRPAVPADAPAIAARYAELYVGKYSRHNPRFAAEWIAATLATGGLEGEVCLHAGTIAAALLGWTRGGTTTYPVFGYDLAAPQSLGLYRRLSLRTLERARDAGTLLHASAGADAFKASRGGVPALEWLAVDVTHLPAARRLAWQVVARAAGVAAARLFPQLVGTTS